MSHTSYEQDRQAGRSGRRRGYQYDPINEDAADLFFEQDRAGSFAPNNRENVFFSQPYFDRDRVFSPIQRWGGESDRRGQDEDECIVVVNILFNFVNDNPIVPQATPADIQAP